MRIVYFVGIYVKERKRSMLCQQIWASSEAQAIKRGTVNALRDHYNLEPERGESVAWPAGKIKDYAIDVDLFYIASKMGVELNCGSGTGYCVGYSFSNLNVKKKYGDWEDEIATPFLKSQGYELVWCWVDEEADGFGPLSRSVTAKKDDLFYNIIYG